LEPPEAKKPVEVPVEEVAALSLDKTHEPEQLKVNEILKNGDTLLCLVCTNG